MNNVISYFYKFSPTKSIKKLKLIDKFEWVNENTHLVSLKFK